MPDESESNIGIPNIGTIYLARMNRLNLSITRHQKAIKVIKGKLGSQPKRPLLSYEERLLLWRRFHGTNEFVANRYGVEPFAMPSEDDYLSLEPIDFNDDFDESLYEELLAIIKG
jgi:hypothetical protein